MGHKERTRQRILNTATHLLAENPRASLTEIAEAAQIGRATLHRYFPGREHLIDALTLAAIEATDQAVIPIYKETKRPPLERLKKVIAAVIPLGAHYHFLTFEMGSMQDKTVKERYQVQLKRLKQLIIELQHTQDIASDIPAIWVVHTFDALLYAAWIAVSEGEIAPDAAAELTLRTLLQGVSS